MEKPDEELIQEKYSKNSVDFQEYINNSRIERGIKTISRYALFIIGVYFISVIFLISYGKSLYLYIDNISNGFLTNSIVYSLILLLIVYTVSVYINIFINRKKKLYNYKEINVLFVYVYQLREKIEGYVDSKKLVYRNESFQLVNKIDQILKEWSVGNISFIYKKYNDKVSYIRDNFKPIIKSLTKELEFSNDYSAALMILDSFKLYLTKEDDISFDELYSNIKMIVYVKSDLITSLRYSLKEHKGLGQIFFTIALAIIIFSICKSMSIDNNVIIGYIIATSIGSFGIYDKILSYI